MSASCFRNTLDPRERKGKEKPRGPENEAVGVKTDSSSGHYVTSNIKSKGGYTPLL
jgi:hypothetical protein